MLYRPTFPRTSVNPCCLAALAVVDGCHRVFPQLASTVNVADQSTANQLLSGYYGPEEKAWCWTERTFSVMLSPPAGAEERGARIQLRMHISPSQIETLGPMTLRVSAGGYPLTPQTFFKPGNYIYSADVPRDALATNILPFKFTFDKATRPGPEEARELAVVVTSVGRKAN